MFRKKEFATPGFQEIYNADTAYGLALVVHTSHGGVRDTDSLKNCDVPWCKRGLALYHQIAPQNHRPAIKKLITEI